MEIEVRRDILQDWPVLVVEDDPASMDVASYMLRFYGAKVSTATNGEEGLKQARETLPKFILTDMSMPIMDGWTMLEEMKKDRKLSSIPVIALTAHAMPGDREKAIAAGCHNYLTKPLTASTFINNLLNVLVDVPEIKEALSLGAAKTSEVATSQPAVLGKPQERQENTVSNGSMNPSTVDPSAYKTKPLANTVSAAAATQPLNGRETPQSTSNSASNSASNKAESSPEDIRTK